MAYRQILVHLDDTERCEARIHYAAELGALEGAHLIGWAPTGWADMPASVGRAVAGPTYLLQAAVRGAGQLRAGDMT